MLPAITAIAPRIASVRPFGPAIPRIVWSPSKTDSHGRNAPVTISAPPARTASPAGCRSRCARVCVPDPISIILPFSFRWSAAPPPPSRRRRTGVLGGPVRAAAPTEHLEEQQDVRRDLARAVADRFTVVHRVGALLVRDGVPRVERVHADDHHGPPGGLERLLLLQHVAVRWERDVPRRAPEDPREVEGARVVDAVAGGRTREGVLRRRESQGHEDVDVAHDRAARRRLRPWRPALAL